MTTYISTKHISAELKRRLSAQFPGVKFSVRKDTGTASAWISVSWTDGPGTSAVEAVSRPMQGAQFNGMTDSYDRLDNTVTVTINGERVTGKPVVDGINHRRDVSPEAMQEAATLWSQALNGADPDEGGMRDTLAVEDHLIRDGWASTQVLQIANDVILPKRWNAQQEAARQQATRQPARHRSSAPADGGQPVTVQHRENGARVLGTLRGDGAAPVLRCHGFTWDRKGGYWYASGEQPDSDRLASLAEELRAAGLTVITETPEAAPTADQPEQPTPAAQEPTTDHAPQDTPDGEPADLTIEHTRTNGTLVDGTSRGDGTADILKRNGFRWSRNLGSWYLPRSRDNSAQRYRIDPAADQLRAAGFTVKVTIDEDTRRSFADAEAERVERAENRAERYGDRADCATDNANALLTKAHDMAARIPFGQPILVGHYSEGRDRRYRDRIHTTEGKGHEENRRAHYWAGRADAAESYERHRKDPARTLRRIAKLEAEERSWLRGMDGDHPGGWDGRIPEQAAEIRRRLAEVREELTYWREIVAKAEADGFKVWGRSDFAKGDFVRYGSTWFEVLRVNPKSVTVPSILDVHLPVVTRENSTFPSMTHTLPYDSVRGRRSAEEMRKALTGAEGGDPAAG